MTKEEENQAEQGYKYLHQKILIENKGVVRHDSIKQALYIKNHPGEDFQRDMFIFTERESQETRRILQYTRDHWLSFHWGIDQEIFPDFLDSSMPPLSYDKCLHLRWEYIDTYGDRRSLPQRLVSRLMAEKSKEIKGESYCFQNGAVFCSKNCEAKVLLEKNALDIAVHAQGELSSKSGEIKEYLYEFCGIIRKYMAENGLHETESICFSDAGGAVSYTYSELKENIWKAYDVPDKTCMGKEGKYSAFKILTKHYPERALGINKIKSNKILENIPQIVFNIILTFLIISFLFGIVLCFVKYFTLDDPSFQVETELANVLKTYFPPIIECSFGLWLINSLLRNDPELISGLIKILIKKFGDD